MIRLDPGHEEAMRRHGETDYPNECCGLLIGVLSANGAKRVDEVVPLSNVREQDARHNRFLIAPEDLLRGERYARERQREIIGFYHSHPDHPAVPSAFDLANAWPVYSYVIVSVRDGHAGSIQSWELLSDRSRFESEEIETRQSKGS
jgi:proteasome lid subunit RPN8/RPN11